MAPPRECASSASRTKTASRSGSAYTATLPMPASLHARTTRTAISPRLATRTFWSGFTWGVWGTRTPALHGRAGLGVGQDLRRAAYRPARPGRGRVRFGGQCRGSRHQATRASHPTPGRCGAVGEGARAEPMLGACPMSTCRSVRGSGTSPTASPPPRPTPWPPGPSSLTTCWSRWPGPIMPCSARQSSPSGCTRRPASARPGRTAGGSTRCWRPWPRSASAAASHR